MRSNVSQSGAGIQNRITLKERNRSQANTLAQLLITPKPLAFHSETLGVFILYRTDEKRQNGVRSPEFHWRSSSSLQLSFPGAILQQNGDKGGTELSLDSPLLFYAWTERFICWKGGFTFRRTGYVRISS